MSFINITDYPALRFAHRDTHGEKRNVIVLAITFDIGTDGELTPAPEQPPINFGDFLRALEQLAVARQRGIGFFQKGRHIGALEPVNVTIVAVQQAP